MKSSYPMYKESTGILGEVAEFSMISVPSNCPIIYKVVKEHIESKNLDKIKVKKSKEESRMYIIKITSGYPLYSNDYLQEMEKEYENKWEIRVLPAENI